MPRNMSAAMALTLSRAELFGPWIALDTYEQRSRISFARSHLKSLRAMGWDVVEKRSVKVRRKRAAK